METPPYPGLKFDTGSLIAVYGPPGSGKTLFALKFSDAIGGSVLFVSLEEGLSVSLIEYLRSLEIRRDDFYVVGGLSHLDLKEYLGQYRPDTFVVDSVSVSTFRPPDLLSIQQDFGSTVIFTIQVTKSGQAAGSMGLLHVADVVIHVSDLNWRVEKSRFGALSAGSVLEAQIK